MQLLVPQEVINTLMVQMLYITLETLALLDQHLILQLIIFVLVAEVLVESGTQVAVVVDQLLSVLVFQLQLTQIIRSL
jgi:hypothetical protein